MSIQRRITSIAALAIVVAGFFTITSRPDRDPVSPPNCPPTPDVQVCLEKWALANMDQIDTVVSTLTLRALEDPVFANACHDAWHALGKAAGLAYGLTQALDPWAYSCTGGYLHGVMSTSPLRSGVEQFAESIPEFCARYESRPKVAYLDCWHGAGHGFAQVLSFPESMYACEPIVPGPEELEWCTWGAAEFPDETTRSSPKLRAQIDATLPNRCDNLRLGHQACYRLVVPMLNLSGKSIQAMRDYCRTQPEVHRGSCMFSLGSVIGMRYASDATTPLVCDADETYGESCAAGFGRYMGRLVEWGIFADDPERAAEVLDVCTKFNEDLSNRCRDEFDYVRGIELSPAEERETIKGW